MEKFFLRCSINLYFEIFIATIRKKECSELIEDCENTLKKSLDLKPTLQALTIKRQLYSLIGNSKDEDNTNYEIMAVNKENAEKWIELKKKNITKITFKKVNKPLKHTIKLKNHPLKMT